MAELVAAGGDLAVEGRLVLEVVDVQRAVGEVLVRQDVVLVVTNCRISACGVMLAPMLRVVTPPSAVSVGSPPSSGPHAVRASVATTARAAALRVFRMVILLCG
ncbi:hypothetical protein [Jiangella alkaliphila]|uniref:hypothetical protein n=1 Tax=Jiangella alkaliphila TaxID=419479 RepID=UPI001E29D802|nr:hypothetical protein [Jiangella alkaliphila]